VAPRSVARGAPRSGDRAAAGMPDRLRVYVGLQLPATGSHLPLEETAPPCAVSPDFAATLVGRGFSGGLPCQAPSEGTPQSAVPRDPAKQGSGSGGNARDRARILLGRLQPAAGSHLPAEETASPLAVRPRAWPEGPRKAGIGQRRECKRPRQDIVGSLTARCGVTSSFGRHCSALRGLIRVVAFRVSHPAKPSSRQRRFVQCFPYM
jgi:hypothetical protein